MRLKTVEAGAEREAYLPLLLLADDSEQQVRGYMQDGVLYVAEQGGVEVGIVLAIPTGGAEIELKAVERLFGNAAGHLVMSSTKSSIGHLLGAAGAVEAIFSILAIRDNIAPPTINLENPSVDTPINLAAGKAVQKPINAVLSNSFGFGGTNATLVMRRVDA